MVRSFQCNDNYDFELDGLGNLAIVEDGQSVADMVRFDISSNRNWILSEALGVDWVNEEGRGLLQYTNNGDDIISTLIRRLEAKEYVDSVESINAVSNGRNLTLTIRLIADGITLSLTTEL